MRQALGKKKLNVCSNIVGSAVIAAYVNGGLPHNVALARTSTKDAWFIHLKKRVARQYIKDGKFIMHKFSASEMKSRILERQKTIERNKEIEKGFQELKAVGTCPNATDLYSADRMYRYNDDNGKWEKTGTEVSSNKSSLENIKNYFVTKFTQVR